MAGSFFGAQRRFAGTSGRISAQNDPNRNIRLRVASSAGTCSET